MELKFDKEIDAILRKGRAAVAAPAARGAHLDADTIAAFAENTLPDGARGLYTRHFAECDPCRKQLAQAVSMKEADAAAASAIWPPVEKAVPWYSGLLRMPGLAVAMGVLVLAFGGVLGYLVLQQGSSVNTAMSKPAEPISPPAVENGVANSAGSIPALPANAAANTAPFRLEPNPTIRPAEERSASDADRSGTVPDTAGGGAPTAMPRLPAAAAAPPADEAKTEREGAFVLDGRTEDAKEKDDSALAGVETRQYRRDAAPEALKKAGPTRAAGPVQTQSNQINTNIGEMPVTRNVGGKTFTNRQGAWYDTAYRQQSTVDIRRGSAEFQKLDSGLRKIANELYGVVVVVWKGKAYRIQ